MGRGSSILIFVVVIELHEACIYPFRYFSNYDWNYVEYSTVVQQNQFYFVADTKE